MPIAGPLCHCGTDSLPTSEIGGSNHRPYVGKLVVAYR